MGKEVGQQSTFILGCLMNGLLWFLDEVDSPNMCLDLAPAFTSGPGKSFLQYCYFSVHITCISTSLFSLEFSVV